MWWDLQIPWKTLFCNTLQNAATHCKTLQHSNTATHCNTLQHIATHCNTLQHTATLLTLAFRVEIAPQKAPFFIAHKTRTFSKSSCKLFERDCTCGGYRHVTYIIITYKYHHFRMFYMWTQWEVTPVTCRNTYLHKYVFMVNTVLWRT